MEKEIWKDIPNYEGCYQVSDSGRVKSLNRFVNHWKGGKQFIKEKILKLSPNNRGYLTIVFSKIGLQKTYAVHKLVVIAFLGHKPCKYKLVVNHKNFNKLDNRVENLEIITNRENCNKKHLKSSSKYTGVNWGKLHKKWNARIVINGKQKHLGFFTDELEASKAYEEALSNIKHF